MKTIRETAIDYTKRRISRLQKELKKELKMLKALQSETEIKITEQLKPKSKN